MMSHPGIGLLNLNRWAEPQRTIAPRQLAEQCVERWVNTSKGDASSLIKEIENTIKSVLILISDA